MILLRVVSKSKKKLERIAEILLSENLAMDINLQEDLCRLGMGAGKLISTPIYRLTAKTKALFFERIEKRLNQEFPDNMPEVYALPIMQMDWKQAKLLKGTLD
ncbi:MAG: hypothetical protein ACI9UR_001513 [Bacteroidia bacterium]|jgi:uncharacterized protein involved in tolerance to divalent cations